MVLTSVPYKIILRVIVLVVLGNLEEQDKGDFVQKRIIDQGQR